MAQCISFIAPYEPIYGAHGMDEKLTSYDPAEDLNNDEAIAIFMAEALEAGDADILLMRRA